MSNTKAEVSALDVNTWLEEHGDYLFAFAIRRIKDRTAAEDLVQDTLLTGIRKVSSFEGRSTLRTWLTGILKLKLMERLRQSNREPVLNESTDFIDSQFRKFELWSTIQSNWESRPEKELESSEFKLQFGNCLNKLKEKQRLAFTLHVVDEVNSREICETLGISDSNLWTLLYRARMRLRDCLEKNWFNRV
jgi:RNA polymerase sigma-70 factor (ECF subfamily)